MPNAPASDRRGGSATYRVIRELGKRAQATYAASRDGSPTVVAISRFEAPRVPARALEVLVRDARCLATNWHPNVARVKHVDATGSTLTIATELLEGATLEDLLRLARARRAASDRTAGREPLVGHAIVARIVLDILAGLQALHGLRLGISEPLGVFHGELCPANVVIGKDGVARIIAAFRPRPVRINATSEGLAYAPPEVLSGGEQDARTDLYAVGVMLWEVLMERRLHDDADPARIRERQRAGGIAKPTAPLGAAAARALAFDRALRFDTAQDMAASMRSLTSTIAPGSAVAQLVAELAGERIRARKLELDPQATGRRAIITEPRPLPARTAGEPSSGRVIAAPTPPPSHRQPVTPPPDDDDDLPGPRPSMPDQDYLAVLSAEAAAGAEVLDSDLLEEPSRPSAPAAPPPFFPSPPSTPLPIAAPLPVPAPPAPRPAALPPSPAPYTPSTRTPFVVDIPPRVSLLDDQRRMLPLLGVLAGLSLLVLVTATILIARRSARPENDRLPASAAALEGSALPAATPSGSAAPPKKRR